MSLNRINQLAFEIEAQRFLYSKNLIFKHYLD
jgi:hypothetical protein